MIGEKKLVFVSMLLVALVGPAAAADIGEDRELWLERDRYQLPLAFWTMGLVEIWDTVVEERGCRREHSISGRLMVDTIVLDLKKHPDLTPFRAAIRSYMRLSGCEDAVKDWADTMRRLRAR